MVVDRHRRCFRDRFRQAPVWRTRLQPVQSRHGRLRCPADFLSAADDNLADAGNAGGPGPATDTVADTGGDLQRQLAGRRQPGCDHLRHAARHDAYRAGPEPVDQRNSRQSVVR